MFSTVASDKPMSEKQRLKFEKFKQKQENLAQKSQHISERKTKRQGAPMVAAKDWIEETPAGHRKILKPLDDDFHKAYLPKVVESAWYSFWEGHGLFKPQTEKDGRLKPKGKYVIAMPPPNVTGKLHIGHALALSLEDTLIRWHRMRQFSTLFIPGCDHAGIATQAVVEKQLAKNPINGKSRRQDFSREEFIQLCQDWKEDYQQNINNAARRLGISPDWSREAFTMSPQLSKAVTETFVKLHEEGLIYRANKLVHWSCRLSTALSTLEVDQKEIEGTTKLDVPGYDRKIEFGTLTYFKYQIEGSDQTIEVATTRPETMLGDTGIAVHPQDDRYTSFVGKTAIHPIIPGRKLRIIADEYVEREFGTGAVKLTPAHDYNDFNLGKKHGLSFINILNEDGTLNSNAGPYAGEKRFNARYRVIEELKNLGLYTKSEPNKMTVPICSRSGDIVEPLLKPQWWMKMESLTKPAIAVVESGELVIRPEVQKRSYLQWMRNLQDWCLSRQLWWGHQIPAYFVSIEGTDAGDDADDKYWVCGRTECEAREKAEKRFPDKNLTLKRDEDVLDTWFSSGLWPFSTLGWPDQTADFEKYFPNTTMETGWDIIPFWVSRMIMFSLKLTGKVPFTEVYCHGLIRDSEGRKMSKSLGNVVDPIDIIDGISLDGLHQKLRQGNLAQGEIKNAEKYQKKAFPQGIPDIGADALRFSLINYTQSSGGDINFDIKTMHGYRKFCNKIYQATKYVLGKLGNDFVPRESFALTGKESLPERWILTKMNTAAKHINQALEEREFSKSTRISYQFLYDELFDIYIENSKSIISDGTPEEARSAMDTLYTTLESGLRLVSPFMPFLTEELWQRLPRRPGDDTPSISIAEYPEFEESFHDPKSEVAYELVLGCSRGLRSLLADYVVKDKGVAYIIPLSQTPHDTASAQLSAIKSLSGKIPVDIRILPVGSASPFGCAVFPVSTEVNVYLEVKDRIQDAGKEVEKFKAKLAETRRDQEDNETQRADLSKLQDIDVTEARQLVERRKLDLEARSQALQETIVMFQKMMV
ncbi:valine-tRNA ligase, mitochondrial [Trichoderma asperellum]|uniref:Valine--tRNA ligase, mitochondrial n=1 Tax=Trichoderma asperellum TaxID=101201 RepID=A0A6V8R3E9_TRIAP|nr:tRNA synthetases class I-domain-containing protein [Trichoderma asperelloides]GFP59581.1 valine-tRNA ligase, mitochondrial [Trichoderma asperellum]